MIEVTDKARHELKKILTSSVDNSYARLRLISRGEGRLGLGIDVEMPGDKIIEYEGSGLLLIGHELASSLDGITIDIDNNAEGTQLVISEKV
jgi:Fe-S cluster assembly iron-binding protein IscA